MANKAVGQLNDSSRLVEERTAELQRANQQLTEFNDALVRSVANLELAQAEILQKNGELERLASRDPLTGCLNRRAFYAVFQQAFGESREQGHELCCLMVNDQYGHAIGDQAIQAVASCLSAGLRLTDTVGRYGGEEFCLMFTRTTLAEASDLAERIRIRIAIEAGSRVRMTSGLTLTVSIGVSISALGARTPLELIDQADKALYAAKEAGRNCVMAMAVLWSQGFILPINLNFKSAGLLHAQVHRRDDTPSNSGRCNERVRGESNIVVLLILCDTTRRLIRFLNLRSV